MSSQAAPQQLELVREFVNTREYDPDLESIPTADALAGWLSKHGLLDPGIELDEDDLRRTHELREALRSLLLSNNGSPLDPAALATVNATLGGAPLAVRSDDAGRPELAVE